jgi:hypothetical protein
VGKLEATNLPLNPAMIRINEAQTATQLIASTNLVHPELF